jgi:hypothetical protein
MVAICFGVASNYVFSNMLLTGFHRNAHVGEVPELKYLPEFECVPKAAARLALL